MEAIIKLTKMENSKWMGTMVNGKVETVTMEYGGKNGRHRAWIALRQILDREFKNEPTKTDPDLELSFNTSGAAGV